MKSIPIALAAHYALETNTLAEGMLITRVDGQVFAFTSHDQDAVIGGQLYSAEQGMDLTQLLTTSASTVDNMEITTLDDGSLFTKIDILAGVWLNANFMIFRYNYASPADGIDILLVGTFGQVTPKPTSIVVELRGLQQYLQQPVGDPSSKTCRAEFGDSRCKFDLSAVTVTGAVTSVTNSQVFKDSSRTEVADYFGNGVLTWTSGDSLGLSQKVKDYALDGTITLNLPMLQAVAVGDTYQMVAGCRKRVDEDCVAKFDNVLNFQGEPHRPGIDVLTAAPQAGI